MKDESGEVTCNGSWRKSLWLDRFCSVDAVESEINSKLLREEKSLCIPTGWKLKFIFYKTKQYLEELGLKSFLLEL